MFIVENSENAQHKEKEEKHFKIHFFRNNYCQAFYTQTFLFYSMYVHFLKSNHVYICSCNLLVNLATQYMSVSSPPPLALLLRTASYSIPWVCHDLTLAPQTFNLFSGFFVCFLSFFVFLSNNLYLRDPLTQESVFVLQSEQSKKSSGIFFFFF